MPSNRRFARNGSTSDRVEEAMRELKVEDGDDNNRMSDELGTYPDRPGEPDCIYYLRTGSCGYGSNCRFNHPSTNAGQVYEVKSSSEHPERAGQPDCGYYLKTGTCKFGATCKYHHPKDRQTDIMLNVLGLPMRQEAKPCPFYMRTGLCRYGHACKFDHPQPALATNVLPVVGPVYGSGGSAFVPSSGAPSASEISVSSLSKPNYYASPLQIPQSYMSLFLPPSQGWNAYVGGVNPLTVNSVLTAPVSNGQLSVSYLPERPDQPECRYFMEHGSCKYGPECRYHHPREKVSQLISTSLGPLGLPLRPGQALCSYYSLYGLCKYGPTCRFDHPMDGYSYANSLSAPPLAPAYSPTVPVPVPLVEASPGRLFKLNEWMKKGHQNSNTKGVGNSPDRSDSLPLSSEANQNHSD